MLGAIRRTGCSFVFPRASFSTHPRDHRRPQAATLPSAAAGRPRQAPDSDNYCRFALEIHPADASSFFCSPVVEPTTRFLSFHPPLPLHSALLPFSFAATPCSPPPPDIVPFLALPIVVGLLVSPFLELTEEERKRGESASLYRRNDDRGTFITRSIRLIPRTRANRLGGCRGNSGKFGGILRCSKKLEVRGWKNVREEGR